MGWGPRPGPLPRWIWSWDPHFGTPPEKGVFWDPPKSDIPFWGVPPGVLVRYRGPYGPERVISGVRPARTRSKWPKKGTPLLSRFEKTVKK